VLTCSFCDAESLDGFKFCPHCGSPFAAKRRVPEERRLVTTLFCDIVNYTAASEASDAEDVDRMLREYNRMARRVVNSCGGVVEKFIGDAVVAVFGVPVLHEDDAERAVRAGLRLVAEMGELTPLGDEPLRVRVGVNTGEAYVRLDVDPDSGESFLTGDAVNTAARLQGAAPPMGVVVGRATHALTTRALDYEQLEPITLKGKAEPVPAWLATAAKARTGAEPARDYATPFIGRERELALLKGLFEKATASHAQQFVLLVGEPGIGKSRILGEFSSYIDDYPDVVRWRQGSCPPYGEGVTFWALGEILKADAGILDSDDAITVVTKLDEVLPEGPDREWFRQRLRPLLGLESPPASRDENFTAWRRYLEYIARAHTTVLVFEDLHWADEALLAFLDRLAEGVGESPLLVVGLTRADVFEHAPGFASGSRWTERIDVLPLSARETTRLVSGLLEVVALPPEVQDVVLERAGGNPLYAEEFTRLLIDRELLEPAADGLRLKKDAQIPLPDSMQALIGARLDQLPLEHKAMLADAAVVGRSFWNGVVEALSGGDGATVAAGMRALADRRLVRPVRASSFQGEAEYMFWHGVTRDVAYQQLPRAARAAKHAVVGGWIEAKAGDRAEDMAELLAHHYATALELARASRAQELAATVLDPAVRFLSLAGDRAMGLEVAAAERHYGRALEIVPEQAERRPPLLARWSEALQRRGRFREAADASLAAIDGLRAQHATAAAAAVMMRRSLALDHLGEPSAHEVAAQAVALADGEPPSAETATVYTGRAAELAVLGDHGAVIAAAEHAIELSQRLDLPTLVPALGYRGGARCDSGDAGGLDDCREALDAAKARGLGYDAAVLSFNYATSLSLFEGPSAALRLRREGLEAAQRRGVEQMALALRMGLVDDLVWAGEWEEALTEVDRLLPDLEETEDVRDLLWVRTNQLLLLACRGEYAAAGPLVDWVEEKAGATEEPCAGACGLLAVAAVRMGLGGRARSLDLLRACRETPQVAGGSDVIARLPQAVRTSLAAGDAELAEVLLEGVEPIYPLSEHALIATRALLDESGGRQTEAAAGFADAAARWHEFGVPYEEAQALVGEGRCLVALERAPEAAAPLEAARAIFARLGAAPALGEADQLLKRALSEGA
jgi:class 3 adenylate cyclase/tetratricopeptide (TPR) repeat protein